MSNKQAVIVYNNINFKNKKRDQVIGYIDIIWSKTTAGIILCPKLLLLGLHQSIYNLTIPLRLKDRHGVSMSDDNI